MNSRSVVEGIYDAFGKGDVPRVLAAFDPRIEWREAEGNPYEMSGKPWVGGEAVTQNLFVKLVDEWDGFTVTPVSYHDAGDSVVVEGRYTGTYKETGKSIDLQFCHVWRVSGGKATHFQQYCDTAQFQDATGSR